MTKRIGCDFDGTLVDYGAKTGDPVKVNRALLEELRGESIVVITNQGGLGFGLKGVGGFPTPKNFYDRWVGFLKVVGTYAITVERICISLYHPKLDVELIKEVFVEISPLLYQASLVTRPLCDIYFGEYYRKPSPGMLRLAEISEYWGDDNTDEEAAKRAGVAFRRIDRFVG